MMVTANASVDIPALKARHPLGDTVEASGVRLRGRGRVRQGVCPFHDEVEGSFTVYADSERWYCFGCGLGGDVLDFIRQSENLSLPDAIRRLDGGAYPAVSRPAPGHGVPGQLRCLPRDPALLDGGDAVLRRAAPARVPAGLAYLASRGFGLDAAVRLGLGFAPGDGLRHALESVGFDAGRLRDCGLFTERGSERFAGMVVVPDPVSSTGQALSGGLVRWLVGRAIDPDRDSPLPGPCPAPSRCLDLGVSAPRRLLRSSPRESSTGSRLLPGASPPSQPWAPKASSGWPRSLRGCPRVFLAFDNDEAGLGATEELADLLGRRAAAVTLPQGVGDMAELAALPQGRAAFLRLLARAARSAR